MPGKRLKPEVIGSKLRQVEQPIGTRAVISAAGGGLEAFVGAGSSLVYRSFCAEIPTTGRTDFPRRARSEVAAGQHRGSTA
jgi:hypothetical protein